MAVTSTVGFYALLTVSGGQLLLYYTRREGKKKREIRSLW